MDYIKIIIAVHLCTSLLLATALSSTSPLPTTPGASDRLDEFLKPPPARHSVVHFPPPRAYFQPPPLQRPASEKPSFFQRMAGWLFPFGRSESHEPRPQYRPSGNYHRPPATPIHYIKKTCNPCNQVPWIPIANSHPSFGSPQFVLKSRQPGYDHHPSSGFSSPPDQTYHFSSPPASSSSYPQSINQSPSNHYLPAHRVPQVTNAEYIPPPDVLPIEQSSSDNLNSQPFRGAIPLAAQPIPFPNLSPSPVPPLYNAKPFHDYQETPSGFDTHNTVQHSSAPHPSSSSNDISTNKDEISPNPYGPPPLNIHPEDHDSNQVNIENHAYKESSHNIQVVKSIPLTEYLSSVEYPVDIIQSPIIDISAEHENREDNSGPIHPIIVENENHNSAESSPIDSYPAASTHNLTVRQENKAQDSNSNNGLNDKILLNHSVLDHTSQRYSERPQEVTTVQSELTNDQLHAENGNVLHKGHDSPILYLGNSGLLKQSYDSKENAESSSYNKYTTTTSVEYTTRPPSGISTSMLPPLPQVSISWDTSFKTSEEPSRKPAPSTKKPKQIQIIIPYTANSRPSPFKHSETQLNGNQGRKVPFSNKENQFRYEKPASNPKLTKNEWKIRESQDLQESKIVTATAQTQKPSYLTTQFIKEILIKGKDRSYGPPSKEFALDIMKLQQNIDGWTEQEFSAGPSTSSGKSNTVAHLIRSKKIPEEYLTTTQMIFDNEITTSEPTATEIITQRTFQDPEVDQSTSRDIHNISVIANINNGLYESDFILPDNDLTQTEIIPPVTPGRHSWEKIQVSISPLTKERVYVVTPLPWFDESTPASAWTHNAPNKTQIGPSPFSPPRFTVRPTPGPTRSQNTRTLQDVASLPESINNLATTTTTALPLPLVSTKSTTATVLLPVTTGTKSTTNTVLSPVFTTSILKTGRARALYTPSLFGLMDLTAYTPPVGTYVETIAGHSKVVTGVTLTTTPKKKETKLVDKKASTKSPT